MAFYSLVVAATAGDSLSGLTTLFTKFTGWMGDIVTTMTSSGNEIMLLPIGIFVVGSAIGLAGRLIGR